MGYAICIYGEVIKLICNIGEVPMNKYIEDCIKNMSETSPRKNTNSKDKGPMLGISAPDMRKIAKLLVSNEQDYKEFFREEHYYFEEFSIHAYAIGYLKTDIDSVLAYTKEFIPRINSWSVCDSLCQNYLHVKNHHKEVFDFVKQYQSSENVWEQRFVAVMFQCKYVREDYIDEVLDILGNLNPTEYYAKMGVAWAIATAMGKFPEQTLKFLSNGKLDAATYRMAIKKIMESFRVNEENKLIVSKMEP